MGLVYVQNSTFCNHHVAPKGTPFLEAVLNVPKGGISLEWALSEQIIELAQENNVKRNRMMVVLIELGLPVFQKIKGRAPALASAILASKRYHYVKRRRGSNSMIRQIQESESSRVKLDDRLSIGLPNYSKDGFRREAKKRGLHMSQIARERMGLKF